MTGQTISHYKILEKLGEGGMGVVYKAMDIKLKRTVALKFLPAELTRDAEAKKRFIFEAQAASALEHNTICNIHEIDETENGQLFIVMAYYEGQTLRQKIEQGPLKIDEAVNIAIQIARGLTKAHEQKIIHRDIKPDNILLTTDGEVKILDFGLAKLSGRNKLTSEGITLGTTAYMSPEQASGKALDQRGDIWSLGVVLYEMITGQLPFNAEYEQAMIYSILNEKPTPPSARRSDVPMELERIILKALAKNPQERYQHMDEIVVDLKAVKLNSKSVPHSRHKQKKPHRSLRKTILLSLLLVSIVLLGFLAGKFVFNKRETDVTPRPVAVISFENQTGDKTYDYLQKAIPNLLITKLEESNYLRVTTWERMRDLLKQMGHEDVEMITPRLGFELCRRDSVQTIVLGSFTKAGDIFATDVKVLDVGSKKLLKSASSKGQGVGSILKNQIDELAESIVKNLGAAPQKAQKTGKPVAELTTSSMEAYNYFLKARDAFYKLYTKEARYYCYQALKYDSTFANAYLLLSLSSMGTPAEKEALIKARQYAYTTSEKWRLIIYGRYALKVENNWENAHSYFLQLVRKFPQEKLGHIYLGWFYFNLGSYQKAITEFKKTLELDPSFKLALNFLGYTYAKTNDFEQAVASLKKYISLAPDEANPYDSMGDIYFMWGRIGIAIMEYTEAIRIKTDFKSRQKIAYCYALQEDYSNAFLWLEKYITHCQTVKDKTSARLLKGFYHYWCGKYQSAEQILTETEKTALSTHNPLITAFAQWIKGWVYFEQGKFRKTRREFEKWRVTFQHRQAVGNRAFQNTEYNFALGLTFLAEGNIDSARSYLKKCNALAVRTDENNSLEMANYFCRLLRAEISLHEEAPGRAIELFAQKAAPRLNSEPRTFRVLTYHVPFFRDILARAYLKQGKTDEAIAEYKRLTTSAPESNNLNLIRPVYHFRLARLYEQKGWPGKATEQYEKFLNICNSAKADPPERAVAEKRLAALNN